MSRNKKILIGLIVVAVLGAIVYANLAFTRSPGTTVTAEKIEKRDLEAIVSASGKIQPVRQVNVGAPATGNVVDLNVREGDIVKTGQLLMQIDPRNLRDAGGQPEPSLAAARSQLEQTKTLDRERARPRWRSRRTAFKRQEGLMKSGLTSREAYERRPERPEDAPADRQPGRAVDQDAGNAHQAAGSATCKTRSTT